MPQMETPMATKPVIQSTPGGNREDNPGTIVQETEEPRAAKTLCTDGPPGQWPTKISPSKVKGQTTPGFEEEMPFLSIIEAEQ
ncbi:UNVERIFIED_CONTAM: hypothetical protein K2H54_051171 [Gekko kuhli]